MKRDFEYFREFLDNPKAYNVRDFHDLLREWAEYIKEHKDEFNYLEDEEWREIRERVMEAIEIHFDLKDKLDEMEEKLNSIEVLKTDAEKIAVYREWHAFMKKYQWEYQFTDERIAESEGRLNKFILAIQKEEAAEEDLRKSKAEYQKSLDDIDDSLFEHYKRTGKRPILSALQFKFGNRLKGN